MSPLPSVRLRQLVQFRRASNRWPFALSSAFCIAVPVAIGWFLGAASGGLIASFGAFTALYGADRPYRNRVIKLATIAGGLACAVALGAWSHRFGLAGIAAVALIALGAAFFCNALGIRPPGAYLFALAGALGNGLPDELDWWRAGLLVLAGGGFSTIVRSAGVLMDPRGPERKATASAATAVALFLKSVGEDDEDRTRHGAAVALHDSWTTLVSRQPAGSANDRTLTMLRSINRELHRLFINGVQSNGSFTSRDALVVQAHNLAVEAHSKPDTVTREQPEHLPLGRYSFAELLQESLIWPSPVLVVSLRVGLAAAFAGLVGAALGLERAYWIVAAAVLVLHQGLDWNRSLQRGLERVIGTLLGLALAGAVLWLAPQGLWLALTLAVLQFLTWISIARNYALAVIFITAAAMMMATGGQAAESITGLLWVRAIDTIIGCTIGIAVLLVTTPRVVAVPIPEELAKALHCAQDLLKFAATGDVFSEGAKRARRNLRYRTMALLTAYELGTGARQHRDFAEALWPAVAAAQRFLYRLHAFCWTLQEAGSNGARDAALATFGDSGQASVNAVLEQLSDTITCGRIVPVPSDVPRFLKDDLEDLSQALGQRAAT